MLECDNLNPSVIAENGACISVDFCPLPDDVTDPLNPSPNPTPLNSYSRSNTYECSLVCSEEDQYFTLANECNNDCHNSCKRCFGPGSDECYECENPKTLEEGECVCPSGFPLNDEGDCEDDSYLYFDEIISFSPCSNLEVSISMDFEEVGASDITWTVTSNSSDLTKISGINTYVNGESGETISLEEDNL